MNKLTTLGFVLLITACASGPEVIQRIPFNSAEFASLPTRGSATVKGQAYIKTSAGELYYPRGEQARLNPVTSYSKQWYEVNYLANKNIADADPRYLEYVYKAGFDHEGNFQFNNIPAGSYYLSAPIFWMEEIKNDDGSVLMKRQGMFVCQEIHVGDGVIMVKNIAAELPLNVATSN